MRGCHKLYLLTSLKNISHLQTSVKVCRYLSAILSLFISLVVNEAQEQCTGRFVNPITDVCWECLFPISIGGVEISQGIAPDAGNSGSPICMCGVPVPRIGVSTGFWEPVRLVDVTKEPFCFPTLGGMQMGMGMDLGRGSSPGSNNNGTAFWHIHYYVYPLVYWLELITDFACMEMDSFDIAYMTELDPLWGDDSLTFLLNPEAVLFSNPIAQAACSADCIKSSIGTPFDELFWCAGCQGSMYPLDGHIQGHVGSIQSALLATERFIYKMHREGLAFGTIGSEALCQKYPMPVMKKSQYRSQLIVPVPSDCYQFGKTTTLYEAGKEIPITGEDFGFLIWRKRNCCVV
jgi:conjugal transfer pilus assembly protein TraU